MPIDRHVGDERLAFLEEIIQSLADHSEQLHRLAAEVRATSRSIVDETGIERETRRRSRRPDKQ
jgi:hypothetical protein